jgi:hypothetical protein
MPIPLGIFAVAGASSAAGTTYEQIATTFGNGSSGTITFSSIPQDYKHLEIRVSYLAVSTSNIPFLRLNGDSSNLYNSYNLNGAGSSASQTSYSSTEMLVGGVNVGAGTTGPFAFVSRLLDYSSTAKTKTVKTFSGVIAGTSEVGLTSGLWRSTSAINSITIYANSTVFATNSRFSLYGIRG